MAIITLPAGIRSIEWRHPPRAAWVSKSGYSGKQTVIDRGTVTGGFRATVTVAPGDINRARAWRAWAAAMAGPVNTVELSPTAKAQDTTLAATVAFHANTAAGDASFEVTSAAGLSTFTMLRAGDFVQIGARLHTLTADLAFANQSPPRATMEIDPPLAVAALAGDLVQVRFPKCTMRLADGQQLGFAVSPGGIYTIPDFELEEVL